MVPYILLIDSSQRIFILDIPCSLEHANDTCGRILSSPLPDKPYEPPEPKGKKREIFEAAIPADEWQYHEEIRAAVEKELKLLHNSNKPPKWFLSRVYGDGIETRQDHTASTCDEPDISPTIVLSPNANYFRSCADIQNIFVLHPSMVPAQIVITNGSKFVIPSNSSFIWSSIEQALSVLVKSERCNWSDHKFDLILMDPPWPNRSVRHKRAYLTADAQTTDPFEQALEIIARYLQEDGVVAIWITNKWKIHKNVITLLIGRGFVLTERWVWTKITTKGKPTTALSGLWRKPYEVLLLFQRISNSSPPLLRHIFAVPDVHSRKPNLKAVFDKLYAPTRVLELFARNLTTGWTSIGDEVLKFQNSKSWSISENPYQPLNESLDDQA